GCRPRRRRRRNSFARAWPWRSSGGSAGALSPPVRPLSMDGGGGRRPGGDERSPSRRGAAARGRGPRAVLIFSLCSSSHLCTVRRNARPPTPPREEETVARRLELALLLALSMTVACGGDDGVSADDLDGDGYSLEDGDCNDDDRAMFPGAAEPCDGVDNDCDGTVDEGFDLDGDGFTTCEGDCRDNDPSSNP